jgi:sugar O-acyltransferase (sialic acid O-acetyltransferase NeuD family)
VTRALLILAYGGHGRVVADAALDCGYDTIAFLDDDFDVRSQSPAFPVLGPMTDIAALAGRWPNAIAAVGDSPRRLALFQELKRARHATPSIVHPSAIVSCGALLGEGVFVAPGAIVNTGARIADAAIINTGARVDHDCEIGDGTHIAPGATLSGGVVVGRTSWIGTGSSVRQGVRIGDNVTIGVGAAVVADIPNAGVYVGVPARAINTHKRDAPC